MRASLPLALLCGLLVLLVEVPDRLMTQRAEAQDHTALRDQNWQEPITVNLASGRSFTGQLDGRTDVSELWLRSQRGPAVLRRPIRWEKVVRVRVAGEDVSGQGLRQIVAEVRKAIPSLADGDPAPARQEIVVNSGGLIAESTASADTFNRRQEVDQPPRVRSLAISAELANWDADVTADGFVVHVYPLDDTGAVTPVRGSLQVDLRGHRIGVVKRPWPFGILERWTHQVRAEDFGPDGAVYRLPFQRISPEFDVSLAPHGAVHARLGVPGQGTFEATQSTVRIRHASPVRDQLQQATGRRFFPHERTAGGRR